MTYRRWALLSVVWISIGLSGFIALQAFFSPAAQFARAQARWAAHAPPAYQAEIVQTYRLNDLLPATQTCTMLVEVRPGAAVQLLEGDCPAIFDVTTIFQRFAGYVGAPVPSRRCGYGGCVCSLSTFQASYDRGYGYPVRMQRDWRDPSLANGPFGPLLRRLPADLRRSILLAAEQRTPCPPGTPNHTPLIAPIHAEQIEVRRIIPLS